MSVDLDALTQLITREAAHAANETDLRVRIEPAIDAARVELGLTADPEREKSLSKTSATVTIRGRADTIYGSLVIEYEPPASLRRAANVAHAAKQARDYMWLAAEGSSGKELEALRRSAGSSSMGTQSASCGRPDRTTAPRASPISSTPWWRSKDRIRSRPPRWIDCSSFCERWLESGSTAEEWPRPSGQKGAAT
ncbi:MAG: hypothetical protein ABSG37_13580 [Candidatus Limnocylindrales bacterium]